MYPGVRSCLFAIAAIAVSLTMQASNDSEPSNVVFENENVRVVRIDLAPGATLAASGSYDTLTVQLEKGESAFLNPGQLEKLESTPAGQTHYFVARSKRSIKNPSKRPLSFLLVEFLRTPGQYTALDIPATHYCNSGTQKSCVTEQYLFCTERFCAESVTLSPGAISTQHTHAADHMVIPVSNFTWREEAVGKSPVNQEFKIGTVSYIGAGANHRLINVGPTTAQMVVIQYK